MEFLSSVYCLSRSLVCKCLLCDTTERSLAQKLRLPCAICKLILFDLRLLKPEEASSVKSNRGLLVLEALLPLPNFEWKTEDGRGHVTAFLSTTMAASAAGPTFNDFH